MPLSKSVDSQQSIDEMTANYLSSKNYRLSTTNYKLLTTTWQNY